MAVAVNYDKALFTHINHDYIETFYPEVKDGWYSSTGGNFKFGLIGSYSINQAWSVFLTVGKMFGENFINYPTITFFAFISIQYKHE